MRNKGVRAARPAPAQGSTHRRAGARGPWGLGPDRGTRPRPASAGSLETGTRRPWPRARGPGFRPDTSRARSRCPAPRGFQDPGQRPRGWRERRRGSAPRAPRGGGCGRGAYPAVRRSVLRTLRSGSRGRRPSGLGCLRPGWRADPRARRRVPRARSSLSPAPRPGHARWPTQASEPGGAVPAGQRVERARGGRPSPPRLRGSGAPRRMGLGSHFTDGETEWRRGCPFAALPVESGARCLRSHSIQPRAHPLHVSPRRELGLREGKPLVRGHSAPGWGPGSVRSPSSRCADISRLRLGRTSGLSLPAPALLSRRCPRPREWSRHEWGVGGKRLGFP